MLQDERRSRDEEAERADGEGHRILQEEADGGGDGRDPPENEEYTRSAGTLVSGHKRAETESCERQEQQQNPEQDRDNRQQKIH